MWVCPFETCQATNSIDNGTCWSCQRAPQELPAEPDNQPSGKIDVTGIGNVQDAEGILALILLLPVWLCLPPGWKEFVRTKPRWSIFIVMVLVLGAIVVVGRVLG